MRPQPGSMHHANAAHQGKASGGLSFPLHLAADRLEVPNLVTGHGTYVGAVEHDDGPPPVCRCGLVRLVSDSRDLRCCLPVGRLDPQGDRVGAGAHAFLVCRRGGQQGVQDTRRIPKRGARAQLGLHPLQLRRAAGGNSAQTGETVRASSWVAEGRQRHILNRGASISTVPNRVCSRRVRRSLSGCNTLHAAQARWWAAYATTWPHSMLACSLAISVLVSSSSEADLRKRADYRRPAERHQLRRRHLARACPRLQPHRPLHQARSPWSGISQADQTQTSKPPAPGF